MLQFNFDPFPIINTGRLLLRAINMADTKEIFALRSDEEVLKYLDRPAAKSMEDAVEFIQKNIDQLQANEGISWAITLKEMTELIGIIGYWKIDREHHRSEIGYMLFPAHQQKGLMQEAITAVLQYGFETMHLHTVEANVNPDNEASKKLLLKNNFVQEAYFKENYYFEGKFLDSAIFSLLAAKSHI